MIANHKLYLSAPLAVVGLLALTASSPAFAAANFLYVDTTATLSYTTFVGPTPIPGLTLTLPAATATYDTAVVTLNMPNLHLSQPTTHAPMAALLEIVAPFSPLGVLFADGGIGCDTGNVSVSGKKPITIILKVPLGTTSQIVEAEWYSTGGTVTTDTYASLSALLVRD